MKNSIKSLLVVIILILVVIFSYFILTAPKDTFSNLFSDSSDQDKTLEGSVLPKKFTTFSFNEAEINLTVVANKEDREAGLSVFDTLPEDQGMLFVFDHLDYHSFWMKNMKFPIDIIWIDENMVVTYIKSGITPESYPEIFRPSKKSLYVLEINAGLAEKIGLKVGSVVTVR